MCNHRLHAVILVVVFIVGCAKPATSQHMPLKESQEDPKKYGDTFDWSKGSAAQFLEALKQRGELYPVPGLHHNWVRDSDVSFLMSRLDSQLPCAFVTQVSSSKLPRGRSTEGHEAAYLLEGYQFHYYPPHLSSGDFKPNKGELRRWFQVWNTRNH